MSYNFYAIYTPEEFAEERFSDETFNEYDYNFHNIEGAKRLKWGFEFFLSLSIVDQLSGSEFESQFRKLVDDQEPSYYECDLYLPPNIFSPEQLDALISLMENVLRTVERITDKSKSYILLPEYHYKISQDVIDSKNVLYGKETKELRLYLIPEITNECLQYIFKTRAYGRSLSFNEFREYTWPHASHLPVHTAPLPPKSEGEPNFYIIRTPEEMANGGELLQPDLNRMDRWYQYNAAFYQTGKNILEWLQIGDKVFPDKKSYHEKFLELLSTQVPVASPSESEKLFVFPDETAEKVCYEIDNGDELRTYFLRSYSYELASPEELKSMKCFDPPFEGYPVSKKTGRPLFYKQAAAVQRTREYLEMIRKYKRQFGFS